MAKYDVSHSCGHTVRVDLIGPHRSREWRIQRMETEPCSECWRQEQQQRNQAAAVANRALELPPLVGTAAQIGWAESIRQAKIGAVEEALDSGDPHYRDLVSHPRLPAALETLYAEANASWWIDRREMGPYDLLRQMLQRERSTPPADDRAAAAAAIARAEATVRPESPRTETVAEIRVVSDTLQVEFPERRDDFRELVRFGLRYTWTGTLWERRIGPFNGTVTDRVVETGHRLLAAGFAVRIYDADLRARAVSGEYEPEPRRWVKKANEGPYAGWFAIHWPRGANLYAAARRIPGSRYAKGSVYAPAEQYEQVLDFAEVHQFHLSPGAMDLADAARAARELALVANVIAAPLSEPEPVPTCRIPPPLDTPAEVDVDNELRDDDAAS